MPSNQSYIEKADLSISNITNEGGLLLPEQTKEFFELIIEESVFMGLATTKPMSGPSWQLNKMGFTQRVLRGAIEGQALSEADRVKPDLGQISLTTKEFIAECRIPYGVVEDNIINGSFNSEVMRLLSKAVARDMEDVVLNGDTASVDPLLSKMDGAIKLATSNVINAGGLRLTKSVMKQAVQTLPSRFLRTQKNMVFLTSKNAVLDYVDSLTNRIGPMADARLTNISALAAAEYAGYNVVPVPMFPENLGTGDKTVGLFLDPKNLHIGMQRDVRVETARDISAREFIIVVTVRFGLAYQHEPAMVKMTNILASAGA